jgi:hypothetical protein
MKMKQFDAYLEALCVDLNRERADRIFDIMVGSRYKDNDVTTELKRLRGE